MLAKNNLSKRLKVIEDKAKLEQERQRIALEEWNKNPTLPSDYLDPYKNRMDFILNAENKDLLSVIDFIILPSGFYVETPYIELLRLSMSITYNQLLGLNFTSVFYRQYLIELLEALEHKLSLPPQPRIPEEAPELSTELLNSALAEIWTNIKPYRERFLAIWAKRTTHTRPDSHLLLSGKDINYVFYPNQKISSNLFSIGYTIEQKLAWYLIDAFRCLMKNEYCFLDDFIETIEEKGW